MARHSARLVSLAAAAAAVVTPALALPGPGDAILGSLGTEGQISFEGACYEGSVSNNGRFLAWHAEGGDFGVTDENGTWDVYYRDLRTGAVRILSLDEEGNAADGGSASPVVSANGRWVVFQSDAGDLKEGDGTQIVLHDVRTGENREISRTSSDEAADGSADIYGTRAISASGRWIVFSSAATNLAGEDGDTLNDVYVADARTGDVRLVSFAGGGGNSGTASISGNGRFVIYNSGSPNQVPADDNGDDDVFLRDLRRDSVIRVSVAGNGEQGDDPSGGEYHAAVSNNGRYAAFPSRAGNLDPTAPASGGLWHVYHADLRAGIVVRLSVTPTGGAADGESTQTAMSPSGKLVTYRTEASNLVTPGGNEGLDQILHDVPAGTRVRLLVDFETNDLPDGSSFGLPSGMACNGRWFACNSDAHGIVDRELLGLPNVYLVPLK